MFPDYYRMCILCGSSNTFPVVNDGYSIMQCFECNRLFKPHVKQLENKQKNKQNKEQQYICVLY